MSSSSDEEGPMPQSVDANGNAQNNDSSSEEDGPMPEPAHIKQQQNLKRPADLQGDSSSDEDDLPMPEQGWNGSWSWSQSQNPNASPSSSSGGENNNQNNKRKKKRRKVLKNEEVYIDNMPSGRMYEKSFMHREALRLVLGSVTQDFVITGSVDGHIKFWKKKFEGIEFVKHFRAHLKELIFMCLSHDGTRLCSIGVDCRFDAVGKRVPGSESPSMKFFDVANFDLISMMQIDFTPASCEFVHAKDSATPMLAVSDKNSNDIHVYFPEKQLGKDGKPVRKTFSTLHRSPVHIIKYVKDYDCVLSFDRNGFIELWDPDTGSFPEDNPKIGCSFQSKFSVPALFDLNKAKTHAISVVIAPDCSKFAIMCADEQVRVYQFLPQQKILKMYKQFDESIEFMTKAQQDSNMRHLHLEQYDFGKRVAVEKELKKSPMREWQQLQFDESSNFLAYPSMVGIKVLNLVTNSLVSIWGRLEHTERFLYCCLFQGKAQKRPISMTESVVEDLDANGNAGPVNDYSADPTLFTTSFKKNRFYLFTKRDPEDSLNTGTNRDVFNEKPTKEDQALASAVSVQHSLSSEATIVTNFGDIVVKLFMEDCPKTVENFCTHARNGYYNDHLFHRVIKDFMIQTGDPSGDGTGGQSIWGGSFEDEIRKHLRHDRPYTLSMANSGPGTNGSQFFITTVNCPHLDAKHTVFGRVIKGIDVVNQIQMVPVNKVNDKPYQDVRVLTITPR